MLIATSAEICSGVDSAGVHVQSLAPSVQPPGARLFLHMIGHELFASSCSRSLVYETKRGRGDVEIMVRDGSEYGHHNLVSIPVYSDVKFDPDTNSAYNVCACTDNFAEAQT